MEICWLFNEKRCHFRNCKYRHVCSGCKGFHPVLDCLMAIPPGTRAINGKPGPCEGRVPTLKLARMLAPIEGPARRLISDGEHLM